MTRRGLVRVIVLATALLACAPAGSPAFSKAIWGPVFRNGVDQFPLYRQLGVSVYEMQLHWNQVAPTRPINPTDPGDPAYQWPSDVDQALTQAKQFHMRVLLEIIGTPAWANRGRPPNWAPVNRFFFSDFAAAAARRYPDVKLWMIWGEPTRTVDFEPLSPARSGAKLTPRQKQGPHIYARMLDAAYAALKRVSSLNIVIGGCTFIAGDIDTVQWIQNLRLLNGRAPRMDMYAHNPFSYSKPNFSARPSPAGQVQFSDLPRLGRWIDRYLRPRLPIFLSEWTIPTSPDQEFPFWVDRNVAASWITAGLRLARGWTRIRGLGWVNFYDDPPRTYGGLLDQNGVRKPGFEAFARG